MLSKHIDVKSLKLKELFENDEMEFLYISSEDNTADLLTKNLLTYLRSILIVSLDN